MVKAEQVWDFLKKVVNSRGGKKTTVIELGNMLDPQTGGKLERGADAQMASERKARVSAQIDEAKKAEKERQRVTEAQAELARQQEEELATQTQQRGVTVRPITAEEKKSISSVSRACEDREG